MVYAAEQGLGKREICTFKLRGRTASLVPLIEATRLAYRKLRTNPGNPISFSVRSIHKYENAWRDARRMLCGEGGSPTHGG